MKLSEILHVVSPYSSSKKVLREFGWFDFLPNFEALSLPFLPFSATFADHILQKNRNQKNCCITFQKNFIKIKYKKIRGLAQILRPKNFFPPNSKLKTSYFQNVSKFLYILPHVTQEKYHNFGVERDSFCKK